MTITKYDGVSILPKRCDRCNRLFWLEPYNIFYKAVGIEGYPLKHIECKHCHRVSVKALEQESKTEQFAKWVATEIFDDMWEYNKDAFVELACRRLSKMGIVKANGGNWELIKSESEDKE